MNAIEPLGVVFPPSETGWDCQSVAAPIVWRDDAGYHMVYQGWRAGSGPRLLGLAESDDGLNWKRVGNEPVMRPTPDSWDERGFEAGCLLRDDDQYLLYYSGMGSACRIGLAASRDLRVWQKSERNPVLDVGPVGAWDARNVAFPAVHKRFAKGEGRWRMTYGGYGERSMQLGTAVSDDGLTWRKHPEPTLPQRGWYDDPDCATWDAGIEVHQMFARGDWYVLLYEGLGAPARYNMGVAFSPDAFVWARSSRNPLWPLSNCAVNQQLSSVHPFLLQSDRILYYVEVLQASTRAQHRIAAARLLDDSLIDPKAQSRLDFHLWRGEEIAAEGKATRPLPTAGCCSASFGVIAAARGRLYLEMDPFDQGDWQRLESYVLNPNELLRGRIASLCGSVRLSYLPQRASRCSAWMSLQAIENER